MTLARTESTAARWFDPAEAEGTITPFFYYYAPARRAGEAHAGSAVGPLPRGVVERLNGRAHVRVRPAQRRQVPQRRTRDGRGREVLLRSVSGCGGQDPEGPRRHGGDRRPAAHPLPLEASVARLHDLLRHAGHRRGLDRPQEIRREGRRRRLQESADRGGTLQVRVVQAGRRAGAGGERAVLAQDTPRQDAGHAKHPRRVHAPGRAQTRRGRRRLRVPRASGRGDPAHPGAHAQTLLSARPLLARLRPRAPTKQMGLFQQPATTGRDHRAAPRSPARFAAFRSPGRP